MIRTFTRTPGQMLALWRNRHLYEAVAPGGAVTGRTDSPSTDAVLMCAIRIAYASATAELDPALLPLTDIAPLISLSVDSRGVGTALLPEGTQRVESVICRGWDAPARIITPAHHDAVARQANRFSRGGTTAPVALVLPRRMMLYSFEPQSEAAVTSCMAVRMPAPDEDFLLTSPLLSKMLSYELP